MRFNGLDLNLLVALDNMLTERNVSRAAEKLHMSQSAASNALSRLREHFKDELLVKAGRTLALTPRAAELAPAVRAILMQIENRIMSENSFDPWTSKRHFRIMASDFVCIAGLWQALAMIGQSAPKMTFEIISPTDDPLRCLDLCEVDLLIVPEILTSADHPSEFLFQDAHICVVDQKNDDVKDVLTVEQYLAVPHVVARWSGRRRQPAFEEWFLERFGQSCNIQVAASSHLALPFLVAGTRRIATLHKRHARVAVAILPLRTVPVPVEIPPIREIMQWHAMNDDNEAMAWLRNMLLSHFQQPSPDGDPHRRGAAPETYARATSWSSTLTARL